MNDSLARAGLAHDAKNLLSALQLYSELLALPNVLPEPHRHYASDLKSLAERSFNLVERLIAFSGAAEDFTSSEKPTTSAVDVLTECEGLLKTISKGSLEIVYGTQAALPIPVSMESLERILVNLVNNAAEATRERGAIRIKVGLTGWGPGAGPISAPGVDERRGSSSSEPKQRMVLTVDDSGCGMTEEQVKKVFMPDSVPPGQGHGIGLHVVRSLVAESGGKLDLISRPGVGTHVEISWALADAYDSGAMEGNDSVEVAGALPGVIDHMEMVAEAASKPKLHSPTLGQQLVGGLTAADRLLLMERSRTRTHESVELSAADKAGDTDRRGSPSYRLLHLSESERSPQASLTAAPADPASPTTQTMQPVSSKGAIAC